MFENIKHVYQRHTFDMPLYGANLAKCGGHLHTKAVETGEGPEEIEMNM